MSCSPENVVSLLESVKNFLSVPNCIWLFAMDAEVISSYIDKKYEGTSMDGYSYLDKIVPDQYHLTVPLTDEYGEQLAEFLKYITKDLSFGPQLNWKRFAHVPRVWTPRRLIKCTRTLVSYYNTAIDKNTQQEVIFALILLYHSWPDFYARFSFGLERHIGGVLVNFIDKASSTNWSQYALIPLQDIFTKDPELKYFIQQAFLAQGEDDPQKIVRELVRATNELRQTGLP